MMERTLTLCAGPGDAGQRLDKFLASRLPELSRARLQALLQAGEVRRDGALIADGSSRVKPGQQFAVHVPAPTPAEPEGEAIPLEVLYEDEHLLVVSKPAGLVVHPAAGHAGGTLVNALLAHCEGTLSGIGGVARPGIVHRLDKDVSGVMVVAKHDRAHVGLAAQFSVHRIERVYEAIAWGLPPQLEGSIELPIGRHPKDRKRMAVTERGKRSLTRYEVLRAAGTRASWLRVTLGTGRTHQIRVHLAAIGLGIVGDPLYRPRRLPKVSPESRGQVNDLGRIALHARRLGFEHPISGEKLRFDQAPPGEFQVLFEALSRNDADS